MARWMRVDEPRRYAGGVSRKLLYAAVADGQLRAARIGAGGNLAFSEEWLDEWLQGRAEVKIVDFKKSA